MFGAAGDLREQSVLGAINHSPDHTRDATCLGLEAPPVPPSWDPQRLQTIHTVSLPGGDGAEAFKRVSIGKLDALVGLAETTHCRRTRLLGYFGETPVPCFCNHDKRAEPFDAPYVKAALSPPTLFIWCQFA